jgi:hypothetical protein
MLVVDICEGCPDLATSYHGIVYSAVCFDESLNSQVSMPVTSLLYLSTITRFVLDRHSASTYVLIDFACLWLRNSCSTCCEHHRLQRFSLSHGRYIALRELHELSQRRSPRDNPRIDLAATAHKDSKILTWQRTSEKRPGRWERRFDCPWQDFFGLIVQQAVPNSTMAGLPTRQCRGMRSLELQSR